MPGRVELAAEEDLANIQRQSSQPTQYIMVETVRGFVRRLRRQIGGVTSGESTPVH